MRLKWRFVPLILVALLIVEIAVFVLVAQAIGVGWAMLALLAFSAGGMVLLAREGRRGWRRVREATRSSTPVGVQAADGIAGAVGALLLFVPGFVSGLVGLVLLIPPVRQLAAGRIRASTEKRVSSRTAGDLFGPRRVKATWGPAPRSGPAAPGNAAGQAAPGTTGQTPPDGTRPAADEVIEGEIVD